jgi:type IV pilus biogenesis protein PilP
MNNYHFRKMPFGVKAALAVLMATSGISTAYAQQAAPQAELVLPGAAQSATDADKAAQPNFKLPDGASVGDANEKIKKLSSDGAKSLQDLVGAAVDNDRENVDVEARSSDKREVEALKVQLEKAKLAKELYQVINGDEDKSKAELETVKTERDDLEIKVKSLQDQIVEANKQVQAQSPQGAGDANPVIVSVTGAGNNLQAKLLIPGFGETTARKGDTLPNGQKVSSITPRGVTVSRDGKSATLAFGTSVSTQVRR